VWGAKTRSCPETGRFAAGSSLCALRGLAFFSRAPEHASYLTDLLPVMVLLGIGAGLSFPALMTLAMSGATSRDSGLASGLVNTTQQVGGALGLAILATLSTTRSDTLLESGESTSSALMSGYHLAFLIATGLALAAIGLAATVLESGNTIEETAEDEEPDLAGAEPAYSEAA
jgi:hypothetical protein